VSIYVKPGSKKWVNIKINAFVVCYETSFMVCIIIDLFIIIVFCKFRFTLFGSKVIASSDINQVKLFFQSIEFFNKLVFQYLHFHVAPVNYLLPCLLFHDTLQTLLIL